MDDNTKALEIEYVSQFRHPSAKNVWEKIPEDIREIVIKDLGCQPYDKRNGEAFRIAEPSEESKGYIFLTNIRDDTLEVHMLPTPSNSSQTMKWYKKESIDQIIENNADVILHTRNDGSNNYIQIKSIQWDLLRRVISKLVEWSKFNQEKYGFERNNSDINKELPEEIVECLKQEGCIPQYNKRIEEDITIPCLHLKSNRQVIWFIKYNFEEDLITIRTPDYNDKDWYSENNLKALLPSNIIFERGRKGRFIFKDLQTSELLKCIPVLVKWITERNDDIKRKEDNMSDCTYYADLLLAAHNIILHGAPGTGKTYLAREIAKKIGCEDNEIGFVQFHPSYDYTDFIEGLRPSDKKENMQIGFERVDGIFKSFCKDALFEYQKAKYAIYDESYQIIKEKIIEYVNKPQKYKFIYQDIVYNYEINNTDDEDRLVINITYENSGKEPSISVVLIRISLLIQLLLDDRLFIPAEENNLFTEDYYKDIYKKLEEREDIKNIIETYKEKLANITKRNFVFIIDEINRGEINKIFGELFYSLDPGYRGEDGIITTQYQKLIDKTEVFGTGFYIPENVYIIGTMNDIDRSVESMDFAFRRRFTFCEIKANDNLEMLYKLNESIQDEARARLINLNKAIWDEETKKGIEGLSSSYHIGGAYFLKLNELNNSFEKLWNYHLSGLLQEYLRGMEESESLLDTLKLAYENSELKSNKEMQ